jgi:hypothetical protein
MDGHKTADYLLGHSIIELKRVKEEGLGKIERQKKLAALFKRNQPDRAVVILSPNLLSEEERVDYYRIMETPIKSHIVKATKQLKESLQKKPDARTSVLLIANIGYNSLDMNEFEDVSRRRVMADTTQIDHMITAGIYFYGDGFDYYTLESFQLLSINLKKPFPEFPAIEKAWHEYVTQMMTNVVTGKGSDAYDKGVVIDFSFKLDGITYVKPSPQIGNDSKFYRHGRPRQNSTGILQCPSVGLIFPHLKQSDWIRAVETIENTFNLQESYSEYLRKESDEHHKLNTVIRPFIPFPVEYAGFERWASDKHLKIDYANLCRYATAQFSDAVRTICESAKDIETSKVIPSRYVFLVVQEIGQDKAFDLCSAYIIQEMHDSTSKEIIFENINIFFEYGIALASSHAIQKSISVLLYKKDTRFKWK